jgi:hypothetical protein
VLSTLPQTAIFSTGVPPHKKARAAECGWVESRLCRWLGSWHKGEKLRFFHSWSLTARKSYFYQDYSDFPSPFITQLNSDPNLAIQP